MRYDILYAYETVMKVGEAHAIFGKSISFSPVAVFINIVDVLLSGLLSINFLKLLKELKQSNYLKGFLFIIIVRVLTDFFISIR